MSIANQAQQAEFASAGKMVAYPAYLVDGGGYPSFNGATFTASVPAGATTSAFVIKSTPGFLSGVIVTAIGSANLLLYDNASAAGGEIIGAVPSNATLGQYFPCNMPAHNGGIVAGTVSGSPAVTVAFS